MSVSVAMATYNGARFLPDQLRSIVTQTHLPSELVVSDDGSSDDTRAILGAFARDAPFPVRVLPPHERFGFADNFLHAAAACHSDLVALSDQDDVWLPKKLETARARLTADNSLLVMHRLTITDERLHPIGELDQGIAGDTCFPPLALDPYMTGWGNTMMFRRELATLIPRDGRPRQPAETRLLSHDTWLYVLAAALGHVSHVYESLILYRQHGANVYGTIGRQSAFGRLASMPKNVWTVPISTYRERAIFDAHMVPLFAELVDRSDGNERKAAMLATERFAERGERWARRVRLYDGTTLGRRLATYLEMLRTPRRSVEAAQARRRAIVKDFVLGVTGFGRRV